MGLRTLGKVVSGFFSDASFMTVRKFVQGRHQIYAFLENPNNFAKLDEEGETIIGKPGEIGDEDVRYVRSIVDLMEREVPEYIGQLGTDLIEIDPHLKNALQDFSEIYSRW